MPPLGCLAAWVEPIHGNAPRSASGQEDRRGGGRDEGVMKAGEVVRPCGCGGSVTRRLRDPRQRRKRARDSSTARADVELLEDVLDVLAHRVRRHDEDCGDLSRRLPIRDPAEDLRLPFGPRRVLTAPRIRICLHLGQRRPQELKQRSGCAHRRPRPRVSRQAARSRSYPREISSLRGH